MQVGSIERAAPLFAQKNLKICLDPVGQGRRDETSDVNKEIS